MVVLFYLFFYFFWSNECINNESNLCRNANQENQKHVILQKFKIDACDC